MRLHIIRQELQPESGGVAIPANERQSVAFEPSPNRGDRFLRDVGANRLAAHIGQGHDGRDDGVASVRPRTLIQLPGEKTSELQVRSGAQMSLHLQEGSLRDEQMRLILRGAHHRRQQVIRVRERFPKDGACQRQRLPPDHLVGHLLRMITRCFRSSHEGGHRTRTGRSSVDDAVSSMTPNSRCTSKYPCMRAWKVSLPGSQSRLSTTNDPVMRVTILAAAPALYQDAKSGFGK